MFVGGGGGAEGRAIDKRVQTKFDLTENWVGSLEEKQTKKLVWKKKKKKRRSLNWTL